MDPRPISPPDISERLRGWKFLLLPLITGVLGYASFPKLNQGYLAWVGLVPLLWFVVHSKSVKTAFGGGLAAGMVQNFGLLVWIPDVLTHYGGAARPVAWILFLLLVALQACYPAVACALTRCCLALGRNYFFVFPAAWVATEYLESFLISGGFPWLLIGYSQGEYPRLIQAADVTGVYGISFLVVGVNVAIAWLGFGIKRGRFFRWWPLALAGVLVTAAVVYGEISLRRWGRIRPDVKVAMLQGNLSFDEPENALVWKYQQGYVQMADRLPESVDLLVLPESPSPRMFEYDADYREMLERLARRYTLGLVFNNIYHAEASPVPRYFNSAYFLGSDGKELGRYDKVRLVPFGEYIPWRSVFFFAETISRDISDFYPGRHYLVVKLGDHPVNAIICFEAVFPQLARRFVRGGSQLIINLTNDGWYGTSAAPYQHLAMSRWRAVENRRYLVRATNSGISAIVDPTGKVQASTGLLRRESCLGRFAFISTLSIYVRYGNVFAILCAIITCFLLLQALWARRQAKVRSRRD